VLLIGTNSLSSITLGILMLGFFPTPLWIFLLPSMQEDCSNIFANQCQKRRLNDLTAGIYNFFITLGQIVGYIIGPLANQRYGATTTSQMVAAFIFLQFFVYYFGVAMSDRSTSWRRKGRRRGRYFARYIV
jgi:predicted MFS family arabinose efflux permease